MLYTELKIYKDTFALLLQYYKYINHLPRRIQYNQGEKVSDMLLDAINCIFLANSNISTRIEALNEYNRLLSGVKVRIRLFHELGFLSVKKSTLLMKMIEKVSIQSMNWRNATLKNNNGKNV